MKGLSQLVQLVTARQLFYNLARAQRMVLGEAET
jgi:hypothetical protein